MNTLESEIIFVKVYKKRYNLSFKIKNENFWDQITAYFKFKER